MVKFINTYHGAGTNSSNLVMYCKKKQKKQKKKDEQKKNTSLRRPCAPGLAPMWKGHIPITYYTPKDNKSLI